MKNIRLKISGAVVALAICFMLIQGGTAENLEHLLCGMEEHTHDASCYGTVLTCEQDDSEVHSHSASCYDVREERVCNGGDDEEHEHTDSCWKTKEVLTCGLSESKGHTHTSSCEQESLVCGYTEHRHSDKCEEHTESEGTTEPEGVTIPEYTEITMEEFLENYTFGYFAFGDDIAPPLGRGMLLKAAGDTWNLRNFVTDIFIKDKTGVTVTNGNFYHGTDYIFNITFAEHQGAGGQFAYNMTGKLVYELPEQLIVKRAVTNGAISGANGVKIGDFSIDTSGRMEIWFGNFDSEGNAISQNFIDYYTNTAIKLDIDAQFAQYEGQIEIDFGTDTSVTVNLGAPPVGVTVEKTPAVYNKANETLDYVVEINAVNGRVSNLALTDTLRIYNPTKPGDSYLVKAGDIPGKYANPYLNVTYKVNGGSPINASIVPAGSDMKLNFSGVILEEGAVIRVEYRLNLKNILNAIPGQSGASSWFQRADFDVMIENTATVSGVNAYQPGHTVTGSDTARAPASNDLLSKKGVFQLSTDRIEWTAIIGDGSQTLGKTNISDALKNNQSIVGDIKLNIWDKPPVNGVWGNPTHTTSTASNVPSMSITNGANGGFKLNNINNLAGAKTIYRIEFIYQTSQAQAYAVNGYYENDISITLNNTTSAATGRVYVAKNTDIIALNKTSRFIYNTAGKATDIEYTAAFTMRAGYAGVGFTLTDSLFLALGQEEKAYQVSNRPKNLKVTIEPADPNFKYHVSPSNLSTNTGNTFSVLPYATSDSPAAWPHKEQRTVTLIYRIALDDTPLVGNNALKLREMLEEGGYALFNELSANGINTGSTAFTHTPVGTFNYISVLKKSGAPNKDDPAVIDYKVELNAARPNTSNATKYIGFNGYPLFMDGQPAIFEDTFDMELEYVPGSFYVVREPVNYGSPSQKAPAYYGPYNVATKADLVTVTGNTIHVDFRDMCNIGTWGGSAAQSSGFAATGSATAQDNLYRYWYAYNVDDRPYKYTVHYRLKLEDDYMGYHDDGLSTVQKLKNTARVFPAYPTFTGGKWENSHLMDFALPKHMTKTMNVSGNIVRTEVIINPGGARMRPLNVANPRFTAVDIMSDTMALYQGSVKIYTKGTDGNWKITPETPQPGGLWSASSVNGQETHFELTDAKAIKITYDALILKPVGQSVSLDNKIMLYGETISESKDNFIVQSSAAVAEGAKSGLYLYMNDQDTGGRLSGAKFDIYMATVANTPYDSSQTKAITVNGAKFYFVEEVDDAGKTGKGLYKFDSNWIRRDAAPANNGVYLIRETRSPNADYICPDPDDPANYTYFVLDPTYKAYWEGILKGTVHVLADNHHLTGKSTLGDVIISGEKRLTGAIPRDQSMTFGFEMTQVNSNGLPYKGASPTVIKEPLYVSVPMTTDADGTYTPAPFTFDRVSELPNGEYYFMVREIDAPLAWLTMTAPQIVRVTVFDGEPVVEYPVYSADPDDQDKVIFENKYKDPTAPFADVTVPINKRVYSEEFDHTREFNFDIEQVVKDTVNGGYKAGESNGYKLPVGSKNITITGDGPGVFILENLPSPETGLDGAVLTYYFRITEIDETDGVWQYDPAQHIVRAEVTFDNDRGGQAKLTLQSDDRWVDFETLMFTNYCGTGGPKLPETGGTGMWPFVLVGAAWPAMLLRHRITTLLGCIYKS